MAELEQGSITENNLSLTEAIVNRFNNFYEEINNKQGVNKAHLPFYYLSTDLWNIHWKSRASQKCPSSDRGARNTIDYISFKPGFFEPLTDPQIRNLIKERLFLKAEEDIRQKDPVKNTSFIPPPNIPDLLEEHFGKIKTPIISEDQPDIESLTLDFAQEKLLQNFIVERWEEILEIRERELQIFGGLETGVEYDTRTAGKIDILAEDRRRKAFTVIELKRGVSGDRHLGQLLRYMGWVRTKLANGKAVFGLLIASKFQDSICFAIQGLHTVSLLEYQLHFQLSSVKCF